MGRGNIIHWGSLSWEEVLPLPDPHQPPWRAMSSRGCRRSTDGPQCKAVTCSRSPSRSVSMTKTTLPARRELSRLEVCVAILPPAASLHLPFSCGSVKLPRACPLHILNLNLLWPCFCLLGSHQKSMPSSTQ